MRSIHQVIVDSQLRMIQRTIRLSSPTPFFHHSDDENRCNPLKYIPSLPLNAVFLVLYFLSGTLMFYRTLHARHGF
jgi:hypothetical protein